MSAATAVSRRIQTLSHMLSEALRDKLAEEEEKLAERQSRFASEQATHSKEANEKSGQQKRGEELSMSLREGAGQAPARKAAEVPMVTAKAYEVRSEMWTIAQGNDLVLAPIAVGQNIASNAANAHELTINLDYAISRAMGQIAQAKTGWEFSRRVENNLTYQSYIREEEAHQENR